MLPIGENAYWIMFYSLVVLAIFGAIIYVILKIGKDKDKDRE
jgi:hypothetical protein